jgi:hypothetical protein
MSVISPGAAGKPGKHRVLKARVKFLSLVKKGANKMPALYKDEGGLVEHLTLMKYEPEQGELLTVTFAPEYRDSDLTIASVEVIKEMAYSHAESGFKLDLFHDGEVLTPEQAFVAESFIIQKGDPRFTDWKDRDGKPVDVAGGWGNVIKFKSPALRDAARDGTIGGVSVYGPAIVALNKSDQLADHLSLRLRGEPTLDPKELVALLMKALDERTALAKPAESKADPKVAELEVALKKSVDESAAALKAAVDAKASADAEIVTLKKSVETLTAAKAESDAKLAEALKTSNAPTAPETKIATLQKSEADLRAAAAAFAAKHFRK